MAAIPEETALIGALLAYSPRDATRWTLWLRRVSGAVESTLSPASQPSDRLASLIGAGTWTRVADDDPIAQQVADVPMNPLPVVLAALSDDDWSAGEYREIVAALRRVLAKTKPQFDHLVIAREWVGSKGDGAVLEAVRRLGQLAAEAGPLASVSYLVGVVRERAMVRRLHEALVRLAAKADVGALTLEEVREELVALVTSCEVPA